MTEQEYINLTLRVKLNSILQLIGDCASYTADNIEKKELVDATRLIVSYHSKLIVKIEG